MKKLQIPHDEDKENSLIPDLFSDHLTDIKTFFFLTIFTFKISKDHVSEFNSFEIKGDKIMNRVLVSAVSHLNTK